MARQPDIQYVQMYHYSSTARKLDPLTPARKPYELPDQQPRRQQMKKPTVSVLEVCSMAVCVFILLAMVTGLLKVGIMAGRQQELESYIESLRAEQADLQVLVDNAYDMDLVAQRARQMGLVDASQAAHIPLEALPVPQEEQTDYTWADMLRELFAKAPH